MAGRSDRQRQALKGQLSRVRVGSMSVAGIMEHLALQNTCKGTVFYASSVVW